MAGTRAGGIKASEKVRAKYGDDFFKIQGARGGSTPSTKPRGFAAMSPEKRLAASSKGGKSRLGKKYKRPA